MNWELVVANGRQQGRHILLSRAVSQIGRETDCHLRSCSDTVSRRHCTLKRLGGRLYVTDCHSTNGTFVNDRRIVPELPVELFPGDRLCVGRLVLVIDTRGEQPDPSENVAAELLLAMDTEEEELPHSCHTPAETNPTHPSLGQPEEVKSAASSSDVAGQLLHVAPPPDRSHFATG
jgi:predicted component of type VI protein secretion system